jgi:hypothetical protein
VTREPNLTLLVCNIVVSTVMSFDLCLCAAVWLITRPSAELAAPSHAWVKAKSINTSTPALPIEPGQIFQEVS